MTAANILRPPTGRLVVQLPYRPGGLNYEILRTACGERTRPLWDPASKAFLVSRTHLTAVLNALANRFGMVTLTLQTRHTARCVAACWEADEGTWYECECSCLGTFHGLQSPPPASVVTHEIHPGGEVRRTRDPVVFERTVIVQGTDHL